MSITALPAGQIDIVVRGRRISYRCDPMEGWTASPDDGPATPVTLLDVLVSAGTVMDDARRTAASGAHDQYKGRTAARLAHERTDRSGEVLAAHNEALVGATRAGTRRVASELAGQLAEVFDTADYHRVGRLAQFTHRTAVNYHSRGLLPVPIFYMGGSPVWAARQIVEWVPARPSAGHRRFVADA